jgi:hypothetical protein
LTDSVRPLWPVPGVVTPAPAAGTPPLGGRARARRIRIWTSLFAFARAACTVAAHSLSTRLVFGCARRRSRTSRMRRTGRGEREIVHGGTGDGTSVRRERQRCRRGQGRPIPMCSETGVHQVLRFPRRRHVSPCDKQLGKAGGGDSGTTRACPWCGTSWTLRVLRRPGSAVARPVGESRRVAGHRH